MDIRYLQAGVSVFLPCFVDGCGLAIGDLHYAQGDGEVSGTAIEMSADVWVTTELLKEGPDLSRGPHYGGPPHCWTFLRVVFPQLPEFLSRTRVRFHPTCSIFNRM